METNAAHNIEGLGVVAESHDVPPIFQRETLRRLVVFQSGGGGGVERGKRLEKRDTHTACSLRETETNKLKLEKCSVNQKLMEC